MSPMSSGCGDCQRAAALRPNGHNQTAYCAVSLVGGCGDCAEQVEEMNVVNVRLGSVGEGEKRR